MRAGDVVCRARCGCPGVVSGGLDWRLARDSAEGEGAITHAMEVVGRCQKLRIREVCSRARIARRTRACGPSARPERGSPMPRPLPRVRYQLGKLVGYVTSTAQTKTVRPQMRAMMRALLEKRVMRPPPSSNVCAGDRPDSPDAHRPQDSGAY